MRTILNKDEEEDFKKEDFFDDVYKGKITPSNLSDKLYLKTANKLKKGVYKGYGGSLKDYDFGSVDEILLSELRENIYLFSGAKTFQQTLEMSEFIHLPYTEFRKKADEIFTLHNETYLQTEYDTAIGQAQSAQKWRDIERTKETFPYLRRSAVMDANTSPECRILNDVTAKFGDKFWDTRSPLTHFECRCIIEKFDEYEDVKLTPQHEIDAAIEKTKNINPIFKSNPGKSGEVFNEHHPYFNVPKKYKDLAENNFNLKIPKNDT